MKRLEFDKRWLIVGLLVVSAVAWRIINWSYSLAPNLELVTASALAAAVFLPRRMALTVLIATLAVSDIIIGNTSIFLFTWSAFLIIILGGLALRRLKASPGKLMLAALGAAVVAPVGFFLYTNFGVWLLDSHNAYANTWEGLVQCYIMGLPFYRTMLLGNLVLVPAYFAAALYGPAVMGYMKRVKNDFLSPGVKKPQAG